MGLRGSYNPVRTVRWGAVTLLAIAGTVATLVISEWPLTGQSIARTAARLKAPLSPGADTPRAAASKRAPLLADWPLRGTFMPQEPDPYAYTWPGLVAAGSIEESRRTSEARSNPTPSSAVRPARTSGDTVVVPRVELGEFDDWWKTTPAGKMVDDITSYDPARTAATLRVSPRVDVTAGLTRFNVGDGPSVGKVEYADGTRPRGEAEVYDFSVRLDALGSPADKRSLNLGAITGLRAASLFDPVVHEPAVREPVPVVGGDARWKWSNQSMLRASALSDAPGTDRDYLDLRLEQVWRFGGDAWLSVGWRRMQGILSNEQPTPTLKQDSILLELKIGF